MGKLEKSVSIEVKKALAELESAGAVCWFERMNSGKVRTEYGSWIQMCRQGTADYIAILPVHLGVMVYFMELKSDTGEQTIQQKEFQKKVESWGGIYEVINDVQQVRITVERVTNFYKKKISEINLDLS